MNKISDEKVKITIKNRETELKNYYGEDRIFGIFVYGLALYGFAETEKDILTAACYIPTEEELYLTSPEKFFHKHQDGSETLIVDMRLIYKDMINQDILALESIFSSFYLINHRYENDYENEVLMNREAMFKYSPRKRIHAGVQKAKESISKGDFFEACRIRFAIQSYLSGASVNDCIKLKKDYQREFLTQVKNKTIQPDVVELLEDLDEFDKKGETIKDNLENEKFFNTFIKNTIIKANTDKQLIRNFKDSLTENEKTALDLILSKLEKGQGNISISQLLEESTVSRPVFKSVLTKMEKHYIAEVTNMGVKGTYIKVINNL